MLSFIHKGFLMSTHPAIGNDLCGSSCLVGACPKIAQLLSQFDEVLSQLKVSSGDPPSGRVNNVSGLGEEPSQFLTTKQAADRWGKAVFTVREYCRLERIRAIRAQSGRGAYAEFRIPITEIQRVRDEGLLPPKHKTRRGFNGRKSRS